LDRQIAARAVGDRLWHAANMPSNLDKLHCGAGRPGLWGRSAGFSFSPDSAPRSLKIAQGQALDALAGVRLTCDNLGADEGRLWCVSPRIRWWQRRVTSGATSR